MIVALGRFGPYVKHNDVFVSIPKGEDIGEVDLTRAIELIKEKQEADAPIAEYEDCQFRKGQVDLGLLSNGTKCSLMSIKNTISIIYLKMMLSN